MADVIDQAQAQTEFFLQQQISRAASDADAQSETHCLECEEPIPEKRRQAVPGCRYCVSYQQELEELEQ